MQYVKDLFSYLLISVENKGVEPLTPCVQGRCSKPTELIPQFTIVNPIVCSPKHYCLLGHCLVPLTLHKCVVPGITAFWDIVLFR